MVINYLILVVYYLDNYHLDIGRHVEIQVIRVVNNLLHPSAN